ncbi:MAG: CAP domain-containing protein, partial [Bacteroidota bacterium]
MFKELNNHRISAKLDTLSFSSFLNKLATNQSEWMAINGENKSTRKKGRNKTIEERSKHNLESNHMDEA